MISVFVHRDGRTVAADRVEPEWLGPSSDALLWVDLGNPGPDDGRLLRDVFGFHELAVEDALSELHHPKIESYNGYLYLILHGIDFQASQHQFATHDIDFFLGANFLVTVHGDGSRSLDAMRELCLRNDRVLGEGPAALLHRIVDLMVDHYQPEIEKIEERIDQLEDEVLTGRASEVVRAIIELKRDVASLRRVIIPQRDLVGRLARREFAAIDTEMAYRFRDVYDHVVRITDEALIFQDRVTGLLEAHVSNVSNRLNEVMKMLTIIATIFMPLTVLTGFFGMNVQLPPFPGGPGVQSWWIVGLMLLSGVVMAWYFHRRRWL